MGYHLTAAVIGSGFIGKQHMAACHALGLELVICSNDTITGQALAQEYHTRFYADYREMLRMEKLDFVSVCLPTHLHFDAAMAALEHRVPVLCEKPFTTNVEEARALIRKAREYQLPLMVGHCERFSQAYEYLKHCINDARFGPLTCLHMFRHDAAPAWSVGNWFANLEVSGGAVKDLHIHDTDLVLHILGKPKAVQTMGSALACSTVYQFDGSPMSVTASASWRNTRDCPKHFGFDAVFENGMIYYYNGVLEAYDRQGRVEDALAKESFGEFYAPLGEESIRYETAYFCHCLTHGLSPAICPAEDSMLALWLNEKEQESLRAAASVSIE